MSEIGNRPQADKRDVDSDVETVKAKARRDIGDATAEAKTSLREAKAAATKAYEDVREDAAGTYREVKGQVRRTVAGIRRNAPNSPEAARRKIGEFVESNPAMVALVGVAAGLLVGALLPGTRREDQLFGRYADDAKDQGLRYARDLVAQGRHYLEDSFEHAREEARDAAA